MNKKSSSELLINLLSVLLGIALAVFFWEKVKFVLLFGVTLGVLITIHEWGHFIAAKASGVRVYEFALGFGPKLVTYMRRNGTDYTIRALPLGGFVNPKGMQPDDPITPDGLNGRRASERALVYLAGPLMNAILGVAVFVSSGFLFGVPDESKILVGPIERKAAALTMDVQSVNGQPVTGYKKGLQVGDQVLQINDKAVDSMEVLTSEINASANKPVTVTVLRHGQQVVLTGTPRLDKRSDNRLVVNAVPAGSTLALQPGDQIVLINGKSPEAEGETPDVTAARILRENVGKPLQVTLWRNGRTRIEITGIVPTGVSLGWKPADRFIGRLNFQPTYGQGPHISIGESVSRGLRATRDNLLMLAMIFSKPKQLGDNVGGVIGIGAVLVDVEKLPAFSYFNVLASLSISLAVFNLLPIPILDGGHLLVLTAEVLRRRRLEPETQRVVALVGMAIIGVLFVLITFKDIMKHFG